MTKRVTNLSRIHVTDKITSIFYCHFPLSLINLACYYNFFSSTTYFETIPNCQTHHDVLPPYLSIPAHLIGLLSLPMKCCHFLSHPSALRGHSGKFDKKAKMPFPTFEFPAFFLPCRPQKRHRNMLHTGPIYAAKWQNSGLLTHSTLLVPVVCDGTKNHGSITWSLSISL